MRVRLFYRAGCPKCRWLSASIVWFSFGAIERIPLTRDAANALALALGGKGRLVLAGDNGRPIVGSIAATMLARALWQRWRWPLLILLLTLVVQVRP